MSENRQGCDMTPEEINLKQENEQLKNAVRSFKESDAVLNDLLQETRDRYYTEHARSIRLQRRVNALEREKSKESGSIEIYRNSLQEEKKRNDRLEHLLSETTKERNELHDALKEAKKTLSEKHSFEDREEQFKLSCRQFFLAYHDLAGCGAKIIGTGPFTLQHEKIFNMVYAECLKLVPRQEETNSNS